MSLPEPKSGLVIRYSYVWHQEAMQGREEGRKDRPCAIVVAAKNGLVAVAPITHTRPSATTTAEEIPPNIAKQLGLDHQRSWIVTNDLNVFRWPGEDIRPATRDSWAFGQLPPNITKTVIEKVKEQRSRVKTVNRDDPPKKDWGKKADMVKPLRKAPAPRRDLDRSR